MNADWFQARLTHLLGQEEGAPEAWMWLSFADPSLPKGSQFLGVVITKARGFMHAVKQVGQMGINPGGEVVGYPCPPDWEPPDDLSNRLLSAEDIKAAGLD